MRARVGLTEESLEVAVPIYNLIKQRMRHGGFRQKEEAIFESYFEAECDLIGPKPATLVEASGVSRATIYRHHHAIGKIRQDYEKFLLRKYKLSMRYPKKTASAEQLLRRMLLFIVQNKRRYRVLIRDGGEGLVHEMVLYLKNILIRDYNFPVDGIVVINMYAGEVYELLREWGKHNFTELRLEQVQLDLLYLTRTAPKRLGPVDHHKR